MGLSLAQSSRKTRIGADPRNTQWANDTDRFGHQQMLKMGWKPGRGLGASVEGTKEHVKVKVKTDSKGLGSSMGQAEQPTGLDVFQRILGKLNGNEEEVEKEIQHKQQLSGLYLQFVPGGVLEGTVKSNKEMKELKKKERKQSDKQKKKAEKQAEKLARKLRKQKKEPKEESPEESQEKKPEIKSETETEAEAEKIPARNQARGIRATRNRYIAMKRQATSDAKGLKEILML